MSPRAWRGDLSHPSLKLGAHGQVGNKAKLPSPSLLRSHMKQHMGGSGDPSSVLWATGQESQRGTPDKTSTPGACLQGGGDRAGTAPSEGLQCICGVGSRGVYVPIPAACPVSRGLLGWPAVAEAEGSTPVGLEVPPVGPWCWAESRARGPFLSTQAYSRCLMNAGTLLGVKSKANEGSCSLFLPSPKGLTSGWQAPCASPSPPPCPFIQSTQDSVVHQGPRREAGTSGHRPSTRGLGRTTEEAAGLLTELLGLLAGLRGPQDGALDGPTHPCLSLASVRSGSQERHGPEPRYPTAPAPPRESGSVKWLCGWQMSCPAHNPSPNQGLI